MIDKLVLATHNKDKIKEIQNSLQSLNITVLSLDDYPDLPDVIEDQPTLEGNAIKKAREISEHTGLPALADDTGLEVDALNGAPGVYSARYAGENVTYADNVNKMLKEMTDVPDGKRSAQFITVMALVDGDNVQTVEGSCPGVILRERRGEKGFGYDPIFYVPELQKTFSELDIEEKNKISHRGKALQKIKKVLDSLD